MKDLLDRFAGHAWTILPTLRHQLSPRPVPESREWRTTVTDPDVGEVVIRGEYTERESDTLLVAIHGLGGSPDSGYLQPVVAAADARGWSTLRLALRGTGGIGNDFYHAGLTADPNLALADETFAGYERIFVVGFSLGGHITLCLAAEEQTDPRVRAVAAVCPPIDLDMGAAALDAPALYIYRQHVLRELRELYRALAEQRDVPTRYERIRLVKSIREWDALTVVPRFGFDDVNDYYTRAGIAGRMDRIARPALMVHSRHDPMVPPHTIEPALERASDLFEPRWFDGAGHVFFPPRLDLGMDAPAGLGPQITEWLDRV